MRGNDNGPAIALDILRVHVRFDCAVSAMSEYPKTYTFGSRADLERRLDKYTSMALGEIPLEGAMFRADCWAIVDEIQAELARRTTVE